MLAFAGIKIAGKGLEKRDGVPPSPQAMAGQVGPGKKNLSSKSFFSLPQVHLLFS